MKFYMSHILYRRNDLDLFAEFVKIHTNDKRPLHEFVYLFGDSIYQAEYVYKDCLPFTTIKEEKLTRESSAFFENIDILSNLMQE